MADFQIPEDPEYVEKIRMLEPTDRAHASIFNAIFQILINNMMFLKKRVGRGVHIGPENTPIEAGETLFIIDGGEVPPVQKEFQGVLYTDMSFSKEEPGSGKVRNWGKIDPETIVKGNLKVSEHADASDTFFAQIKQ